MSINYLAYRFAYFICKFDLRGGICMKIRLTGSEQETCIFADMLDKIYDVVSISEFYPNTRKNRKSKEGRVYMEIKIDLTEKRKK